MIDYRSDTFTLPTPGMRQAMASAPLGDDVYGEDPSVNRLEAYAAERFGVEAALFCASGTMTNQIAIAVHTRLGDEVICHYDAHIYLYEGGGIMATSGASVKLLSGPRGLFTAAQVQAAIQPDDPHKPRTALVALENTINRGGGACWALEDIRAIRAVCDEHALPLHLDGARLYNALIAQGEQPQVYGQLFDSISLCLSKGLGAPVGSLLLGSKAFIHQAKRVRKRLGGGWRQAGMLAAAGLYALEHQTARLAQDHAHAQQLAAAVQQQPYLHQLLPVETNIVLFELSEAWTAARFFEKLEAKGIRTAGFGGRWVRFVTHLNLSEADVAHTVQALHEID